MTPITAPGPDATDDRIVDAAIRVLGSDPAASMQQVASVCGCGRATVYRHFANREELVRAIRLRALADCRRALPPGVWDREPVHDALDAVLETLIPLLDRYRVLLDAPPPDLSDPAQRELTDAIVVPLRDLIRRGQAAGEIDPMIPPDFAVAAFSGVLRAAREAVACGTMTLDAAHAHAVRVLITGICAEPRPASL